MPGFNNTIHSTTIYGQIFSRGIRNLPRENQQNFVGTTMNSFPMLKQISRFDKAVALKRGFH